MRPFCANCHGRSVRHISLQIEYRPIFFIHIYKECMVGLEAMSVVVSMISQAFSLGDLLRWFFWG